MTERASGREAIVLTFAPAMVKRSAVVALVVGTILNLINQGDAMVAGQPLDWLKIALTYFVPYCVASYGAYCACRHLPRR